MIRHLIKEQLKRCQFANLHNFNATTNTYLIPKYSQPTYKLNKCYLVKLPVNILNTSDSVLAVNWNNGSCPKTQYLKIFVSKALGGNMIFVDSIGFDFKTKQDLNLMWSGWLDSSQLIQISAL